MAKKTKDAIELEYEAQLELHRRLVHVLEWIYTTDGEFKNRNEWRRALVAHLEWLVGLRIEPEVEEYE